MQVQCDPIIYTVEDLQRIFKCGKATAYGMMHTKGFPSFKIGKYLYVEKSALNRWIDDGRYIKK